MIAVPLHHETSARLASSPGMGSEAWFPVTDDFLPLKYTREGPARLHDYPTPETIRQQKES